MAAYGKGGQRDTGKGKSDGRSKGSGSKGKGASKGGTKGKGKARGNGWNSNMPCLDFFTGGYCPRDGDCKWSHAAACHNGPTCEKGEYCKFTHDWNNVVGLWFVDDVSVQPESEPWDEGGGASDDGQGHDDARSTFECKKCDTKISIRDGDPDGEQKRTCPTCKEAMPPTQEGTKCTGRRES